MERKGGIKIIDRNTMTRHEIEQHFFKKGYEYALLHFQMGMDEENLRGIESLLMKYMNFLNKN